MQIHRLKPAWKQHKLLNGLPSIDSKEILLLIEQPENPPQTKLYRVLFSTVIFIFLTIICHSG